MSKDVRALIRSWVVLIGSVIASGTLGPAQAADEGLHFEGSLYWLAFSMSGEVGTQLTNTEIDADVGDILEDLEFGGMARLRVSYEPWAFATDVLYTGLGISENGVHSEIDQWIVEPTIGYRLSPVFELIAGARYTSVSGEFSGPGVMTPGGIRFSTHDWWYPIVGTNVQLKLSPETRLDLRADIGGFDPGSEYTWQIFPAVTWLVGEYVSLQAGYRWLYVDYVTGSGPSEFHYDILTEGAQLGLTMLF
jgi:hypothetical protein